VRPTPREKLETTHLSVVDGDGNAVGLTTTLNGSFGCGLLVPELEILLNNEMDDFAVAPGKANLYGLVQGEANAVGPGKRMLSSMTPTIAWRGSEVLVLGSPGGSRIPTATGQVLLDLVVDGDTLQAAVERPRVHHQWLPDELAFEDGALAPKARKELGTQGHTLRHVQSLGEVNAVRRRADGALEATADPRGPGSAGIVP
jgi:gamma-glutamyltranspeptidase/glutathione hydrolase